MSFTPAQVITSSQSGMHDNLTKVVTKHLNTSNQKPIAEHNRSAFEQAYGYWQEQGKPPVMLDSGCGTGESSRYLAKQHSDCLIIGLDQSAKRLQHNDNQVLPNNCLLLRCECTDFWRLAEQAQWQFKRHTLFYPNPYPKPQHLQRRWHGEAALPSLLSISQQIELRTNWEIYAQEFYHALSIAAKQITAPCLDGEMLCNRYTSDTSISAFERKYQQSGHTLWQVLTHAKSENH